jgi:hypothetical protein
LRALIFAWIVDCHFQGPYFLRGFFPGRTFSWALFFAVLQENFQNSAESPVFKRRKQSAVFGGHYILRFFASEFPRALLFARIFAGTYILKLKYEQK